MQDLVNAVRGVGAKNVILVGGLSYSNDLSQWLSYKPYDPLTQLAASAHLYNFNKCSTSYCWESELLPVAKHVPLIIGEFGEDDCQGDYVKSLAQWFLGQGPYSNRGFAISRLAWTWNKWDCKSGPAVISEYDGSCTDKYGCTVKNIFQSNPHYTTV